MKELYIAPEVKLLGFVAEQKLASVDFDDLLAAAGKDNGVEREDSDVSIDIL